MLLNLPMCVPPGKNSYWSRRFTLVCTSSCNFMILSRILTKPQSPKSHLLYFPLNSPWRWKKRLIWIYHVPLGCITKIDFCHLVYFHFLGKIIFHNISHTILAVKWCIRMFEICTFHQNWPIFTIWGPPGKKVSILWLLIKNFAFVASPLVASNLPCTPLSSYLNMPMSLSYTTFSIFGIQDSQIKSKLQKNGISLTF